MYIECTEAAKGATVCVRAYVCVSVCACVCVGGGGVNSSIQKRPQNKSGGDILADSS